MKKTFNLKKHIERVAYYEGVQGYMVAQTRAWQNCVKCKMDDGNGAQESWEKCLDEYQKTAGTIDWIEKNCGKTVTASVAKEAQQLQMGSYWEEIRKYKGQGLTTAQAVSRALKDCEKNAGRIPREKPPANSAAL